MYLCVVEVGHVPSLRALGIGHFGRGVAIVIVVSAHHVPA